MIFLDTNVLSELVREQPDENVVAWFKAQRQSELATTSVAKAEVLFGLKCMAEGKKRDALTGKIQILFCQHFDGRVAPFDDLASQCYATLGADRTREGTFPGVMDTLMAAIVVSQDAALATRNRKDFCDFPLTLIDPWSEPSVESNPEQRRTA